jgi:hypothetical protein
MTSEPFSPAVTPRPMQRWHAGAASCALALLCAVAGLPAAAQTGAAACGDPFRNHFGPFDYRTAPAETRKLVEDFHFTPGIQSMTRPKNTMMHDMAGDVSYTLGVFPNHPRALLVMSRLAERWKSDPPPGTQRSVECWFDRAVRFQPDDTVARSLYAQFLAKRNRVDDAVRQLQLASEAAKDNPLSHHNIGLVYLEIGRPDAARDQARRARELGFQGTQLIEQLRRAGRWADADDAPPARP